MEKAGFWGRLARGLGFGGRAAPRELPGADSLSLAPMTAQRAFARAASDGSVFDFGFGADGLQNVVAGLGTSRDKRAFSQYVLPVILDRQTLEAAYTSSWLVGKGIDLVADDMTREWRSFTWDGYDTAKSNAQMIEAEEARLGVRQKWNEGQKWARLYGGASALLDIAGQADLSQPLIPETIKKGQLRGIHIYDRWWCAATGEIDYDRAGRDGRGNPNFGMPTYYMIGAPGEQSARVHWSRLIRFEGRRLPRNLFFARGFWHDSVLQHVIDTIQDYDAMTGGVASMVWEANVDILMLDKLAELLGTAQGEAKIQKLLTLAVSQKSINRVMLLDKEKHDYKQKTTQFSGVRDILVEYMGIVSGAWGVPITKLFGTSAKGLNATGEHDERNYYDEVRSRQNTDLRPGLDRFDQVFIRSTLGAMPKNYRFDFKPLWLTSKKEEAEIANFQSQADERNIKNGIITAGVAARELKDRGYYRTMEPRDVELAESLAQEMLEDPREPDPNEPPAGGAGGKGTKPEDDKPKKPGGAA
jgi:phage-related protein (TIGR01555 family)